MTGQHNDTELHLFFLDSFIRLIPTKLQGLGAAKPEKGKMVTAGGV